MTTTVIDRDSIRDLREQIFANAAVTFPRAVEDYLSSHNTLTVRPAEIFDVVISSPQSGSRKWFSVTYQAILVYGDPLRRKIAAKGPRRGKAQAALDGLLDALTDSVGHTFKESAMERPVSFGKYSVVDLGLAD